MISINSMTPTNSSDCDSPVAHPEVADLVSQPDPHQADEYRPMIKQNRSLDRDASASTMSAKTDSVNSRLSPWLASLVYPIGRYGLLPFYFRGIEVLGREHLPTAGPVILAPTHRSRWDAFMIPYIAGQDITGRILRFMVSADEMTGLQGWFIRRLGGFSIDTQHPAIASLRHSVELLQNREVLVIFPEGGDLQVNRSCQLNRLQPGLARLALQSEASQANLGVQIVPISISYSCPSVPWRSAVKICIGAPLNVADYSSGSSKLAARQLTGDLQKALQALNEYGIAEES
ncbi:lysophospholipid acyltransferase family protein [Phormidesmis priestleyi]|uniref:lysophospholipid acyltransferase family protein n=1 Tax=Phormidesmis priestleyi TaxID=268141 RepID=UPI001E4AD8C5|nr:lysophospholipid acyltransferase family protein [Phormidesmis priestleyi]